MTSESGNDCLDRFQSEVGKLLIRNSNILDIMTKIQISCAKLCRSAVKSATGCGCTCIIGGKNETEEQDYFLSKGSTGVDGKLCDECKDIIEGELGETLFYIASLCNAFDLSMKEIAEKEAKNMNVLGKYSLR